MGQKNQSNNFEIYNISLHYDIHFEINELGTYKITQIIEKISIKSLFILWKRTQAVVQKTSRKNVTSTVLIFFCLFDGRSGWKYHNQLKTTALKQKKKKHMHTGKVLEAQ